MLATRFAAMLSALGPFANPPHLAVALSGGADSMALTLLADAWARAQGGHITALTVDHALRAESRSEAQQVTAWMRARDIEHHILTPAHDGHSNNLQEAARTWRYRALADFCRAQGILNCLVAHNASDNRETIAHNLARGDTADGTSGMRQSRNVEGVRFLRPLLSIERTELEDYLRTHHAPWVTDPSNQNRRFARVRTRHALAADPARVSELDALIARESTARTARDHALAAAAMQCASISPLGFAEIDLAVWRGLAPALGSQLLADCLVTIGGQNNRPRAGDTARLAEALLATEPHQKIKRTLAHCEITLSETTLRIAREPARVAAPLVLSGEGSAVWDGRFRIHHALPSHAPLTLRALGADGKKQLTHLSPVTRHLLLPSSTPSLWHLDELHFVPHIGMPQEQAHAVTIGFCPPKPLAAAPFW